MRKVKTFLLALTLLLVSSFAFAQTTTFYPWRYRTHATDCTALTDGKATDLCFEADSTAMYKCVPSSGSTCTSASDWKQVSGGGSGTSVSDESYGSGWNGVVDTAPSQNAVYDKLEALALGNVTIDWGNIQGNIAAQTDLVAALAAKQNSLTFGTLSGGTGLTVTGGTSAVIGSGTTVAPSSGYFIPTTTEQSTWNAKQSALTFPYSVANSAGAVALTNDLASPGLSKLYGTDTSGTKGWYDIPSTSSAPAWGNITGTLSSQTDLNSALAGKEATDADLTAIAALAGTTGFLKKTAANTWTLDTNTYLTAEVDGSTTNEIEVVDEAYSSANFNGGTTSAVSQDDFYDYNHLGDTDDDGLVNKVDTTTDGFVKTTGADGTLTIDTTTYENTANKNTSTSLGTSNTYFPTQNAVKTYVDTGLATKQNSLGYTAENSANKVTSISGSSTDVQYPSAKLLYDQLALKQAADSDLNTWAGVTPSANGQSLVAAANYAAMRGLLDLEAGTDFNAYDADLTTWAGITPGSGVGTFLATPSSSNLASAVTGETGTGALVFATSPTLVTPILGNATADSVTLNGSGVGAVRLFNSANTFYIDLTSGSQASNITTYLPTTAGTLALRNTAGEYTTAQVTEVTNLYYTDARARAALSAGTGISYNSTTGVIANTGGSSTPGGSDTQVQFNDGGSALGGNANFTFDKTTNILTLGGTGAGYVKFIGLDGMNTAIQAVNQTGNYTVSLPALSADTTMLVAANIGSSVQAYDADLATWAGVTPSANGQSLVAAANYAAMRGLLDLEAGTDFNAYDADIATIAAPTAWRVFYSNGSSALTELALGASGTYLKSNGASSAPSFDTPSGTFSYPGAGIPVSTGSAWGTSITTSAGLYGGLSDETGSGSGTPLAVFNQNPTINGATITGVWDAGGATSTEIVNGATPTVDADGEIAINTTDNSISYYSAARRKVRYEFDKAYQFWNVSATTDNQVMWVAPFNCTITGVGCIVGGTAAPATAATFTLEDGAGNAMTITGTNPTCVTQNATATYAAVTAGNTLVAGEALAFDTTNTPTAGYNYTISIKGYWND